MAPARHRSFAAHSDAHYEYQPPAVTNALERNRQDRGEWKNPNTRAAYSAKQQEFIAWCKRTYTASSYPEIVDGHKLTAFLQTEVIYRKPRARSSRLRKDPSEPPGPSSVEGEPVAVDPPGVLDEKRTIWLAQPTIRGYVSAVVDLWLEQQEQGVNNNANPRLGAVSKTLRALSGRKAEQDKEHFVDRGLGTTNDGYSTVAELVRLSEVCLQRNNHEGLRDRLMALLSHHCCLRGGDCRDIQFADAHSVSVPNEPNATDPFALVIMIRNGKTNKDGRKEGAGTTRAEEWQQCAIGALAMWLFYVFHLSGRAFAPSTEPGLPSFLRAEDYYGWYLFPESKDALDKPLQPETHRKAVSRVLQAAGIKSSKATHVFRGCSARMADMAGSDLDNIRRAGRWDTSVVSHVYLSTLAWPFMQALTGQKRGSFWLRRDVPVPPALLERVFPWVEMWLNRMADPSDPCTSDLGGKGFLELLIRLRTVLLQDSVLLQRAFPQHMLFHHELFQSEEYRLFAARTWEVCSSREEPGNIVLQRALPLIATAIAESHKQSQSQADRHAAAIAERFRQNEAMVTSLCQTTVGLTKTSEATERMLSKLFNGQASFVQESRLRLEINDPPPPAGPLADSSCRDGVPCSTSNPPNPLPTPYQPPAVVTPALRHADNLQEIIDQQQRSWAGILASPGAFKMNRSIFRVTDLWTEWEVGWHGQPSVQKMYGDPKNTSWKKDETERKHFARRRILIDEIVKRSHDASLPPSQIAEQMEAWRSQQGLSLHKLSEHIKQAKEALNRC